MAARKKSTTSKKVLKKATAKKTRKGSRKATRKAEPEAVVGAGSTLPGEAEDFDPSPFEELGTSGLEIQGGRIYEEFLPALSSPRRRVQVFKEMKENDPTVSAVLFAAEMLIRGVEWRVEPASEEDGDVEAAEFLESCLGDMANPWDDLISMVLTFLPFGFSLFEEVYKVRRGYSDDPAATSDYEDGRIGWQKLGPRAQETIDQWAHDENGYILGVWQLGPPDWRRRFIPADRFLLFRTSTQKANPEGRSVLRGAYRPWYYKKRIEDIEGIGLERDLAGLPVAYAPPKIMGPGATDADKAIYQQLKKIVRNIRRDEKEGLVFPLAYRDDGQVLYKLELLSTGGRRQFDTSQIITRYDRRIAQTVLADFILLGQEAVGSFALADSKTALFAVAIGAWMGAIAEQFNRVAIPRLFRLNTFDTPNGYPQLVHGDIEQIDLATLGEYVSKLAGAGLPLFPNPELERELLSKGRLPALDEEAMAERDRLEAEAAAKAEAEAKEAREASLAALNGDPPPDGGGDEPEDDPEEDADEETGE